MENTNANLARVEQPKKFAIIPKELDPEEEGEPITATRKVQRDPFYQRFKELVESMDTTEEEERITGEVGVLEKERGGKHMRSAAGRESNKGKYQGGYQKPRRR